MAETPTTRAASLADAADLAQGASINLAGRIAGRGLWLLTQIAVGRIFGPQAYGLYAIGWTILRISALVSLLGFDNAIFRFGARYRKSDPRRFMKVIGIGIGLPFSIGALVGGALYLSAPFLATQIFDKSELETVIRWFSLGIGPLAGMQAAVAATRISKRMKYAVLSEELTQPALALSLIILFSILGIDILGAVAATVLSIGAGMMVAVYYVRRLFPGPIVAGDQTSGIWRELVVFSVAVSGSRIFITLITWIDRLVLGSNRPAAEVGIYQAAAQTAVLFVIILSAFNSIFAPIIADLWQKNELGRLQDIFRTSTKWGLYLSLPLFVVMLSAPGEILSAVFGSAYADGALALVILASGQLINAGTGGVGLLLSLTGHHRIWVRTAFVMLILDVVLNLVFVPRFGLVGAAAATAATTVGLFVIGLVQVRAKLGLWPYDRRYFKGFGAALFTGAVTYALSGLDIAGSLVGLAAMTLVAVAVFGAALFLLGLDAEDRELLGMVRSRLWMIPTNPDE